MEEVSGWWRVIALALLIIYALGLVLMIFDEIELKKELEKQNICYYDICEDGIYTNAYYEEDICYCYQMVNGEEVIVLREYMKDE